MKYDDFSTRMKEYESNTTQTKLIPLLPVIARLDGHGFSKWTKGLSRPYDERLSKLMIETTKHLHTKYNATISYTQSDEITLVWYIDNYKTKMEFSGKLFKLTSLLAATASVFFNKKIGEYLPEKINTLPEFDCRVWNVPNLIEVANCLLWREQDATKNSISMAASHYYSHNFLLNKSGKEKQELLHQKGINWNDYPNFFKKGTYIQKRRISRKFNTIELNKLPENHEAHQNPDLEIERWEIKELDIPMLSKISNKVDVLLFNKNVILYE